MTAPTTGPLRVVRRVSLLAVGSAAVAVLVLLAAAVTAAVGDARAGTPILLVLAALATGFGLVVGWRPALGVATGAAVLAGVWWPDGGRWWGGPLLVAFVALAAHELSRLSLDLRRPTRLGPGVIAGLVTRAGLAMAVATVVAIGADLLAGRSSGALPDAVVPAALLLAAVPVALPWVTGIGTVLDGASAAARGALAALVLVAVLGTALLGSAAEPQPSSNTASSPPARSASVDPTAEEAVVAAPADAGGEAEGGEGGSLVTLLVVVVAAVALLLLLQTNRERVSASQAPVELEPEEVEFRMVTPTPARLEDEPVALDERQAAEMVAAIGLDLRTEPDPGRAVRYAYARVERQLAALGVERRPSESEPELLRRALGAIDATGGTGALAELTALFERARFSGEPVPESMRTAALADLDRLVVDLDRGRSR